MTDSFSFNLWTQPWITVEQPDGGMALLSLEQTLLHAQDYRAIYDTSPLVIVGVHRLLTAILQSIVDPQKAKDLRDLWEAGCFPAGKIAEFGKKYEDRFDLFSQDAPFMQSADLPRKPEKGAKTIGYLADELPAGTATTHFRHGGDDDKVFCPSCAARGLLSIPAFASSGGAGIKPSINGVPPIYVLPMGETVFASLCESLVLPAFQPTTATLAKDAMSAWQRPTVVQRGTELAHVGYVQSLVFMARRVRLQPELKTDRCTRCGATAPVLIKSIVYEMGESRPKDAAFWRDPFAAYRQAENKPPIPVRPTEGKVLWREFGSLFLKDVTGQNSKKITLLRPRVLDQLSSSPWDQILLGQPTFRCIGMRTDMKAKIFEWLDVGFDVPMALLMDDAAGLEVGKAVEVSEACASAIFSAFKVAFNTSTNNGERFESLRQRMRERYWTTLSAPFREFVLRLGSATDRNDVLNGWIATVMRAAFDEFKAAANQVGDDAVSLRQRVQGEAECRKALGAVRKRYIPESDAETAARAARESQRGSKKRTNQTRSK